MAFSGVLGPAANLLQKRPRWREEASGLFYGMTFTLIFWWPLTKAVSVSQLNRSAGFKWQTNHQGLKGSASPLSPTNRWGNWDPKIKVHSGSHIVLCSHLFLHVWMKRFKQKDVSNPSLSVPQYLILIRFMTSTQFLFAYSYYVNPLIASSKQKVIRKRPLVWDNQLCR